MQVPTHDRRFQSEKDRRAGVASSPAGHVIALGSGNMAWS
jgi:hypothetical protein